MNIDDFWLGDEDLLRLSRQVPSTEIGKQLSSKWKGRFVDPQPSEFYRGYAIVLWALWKHIPDPITVSTIQRVIDEVHDARMASRIFKRETDPDAGAVIAAANAWEGSESGIKPDQIPGAYESELIYVAKLFAGDRSRERVTTAKPETATPPAPPSVTQQNDDAGTSDAGTKEKRRRIAAAMAGVIGLVTYSSYPYLAVVLFLAAGFFFFGEQSADKVLDKLLSSVRSN